MRVFFFRDLSQNDKLRDDQGNLVIDENTGKPRDGDYITITVKVPKDKCTIDFRTYARWSPLNLEEVHTTCEPGMMITEELRSALERVFETGMNLVRKPTGEPTGEGKDG